MSKILITGGCGFIGQALVNRLWQDHDITIFDNLLPQVHGYPNNEEKLKFNVRANFIWGDVSSAAQFEKVLEDKDIIIHLAAETGTAQSMTDIKHHTDVNIGGMAILSDYIVSNSLNSLRVILPSSRAVYGEGSYNCTECGVVYPNKRDFNESFYTICPKCGNNNLELIATKENDLVHPDSVYGMTKQVQEQLLNFSSTNSFILRLQNVYGPGESLINTHKGILVHFAKLALKNEPIELYEHGKIYRDFVYIDDVVDAFESCINCKELDKNETLNIGSGLFYSLKLIAELIVKHYRSKSEIILTNKYRIGDIRGNYADIFKAAQCFEIDSRIGMTQGLKTTLDWIKENA